MSEEKSKEEISALQTLLSCLSPLEDEVRLRLLKTVVTFLDIKGVRLAGAGEVHTSNFIVPEQEKSRTLAPNQSTASPPNHFSGHDDISAKEFLLDKDPQSDVERVACIAFYLTHYRNMPHFKTLDISTLNTEAAQIKFSNAAAAVDNATKMGYLVTAVKGNKQIGALGEQYVRALPDREAANEVRAKIRTRKHKKTTKSDRSAEQSSSPEVVTE